MQMRVDRRLVSPVWFVARCRYRWRKGSFSCCSFQPMGKGLNFHSFASILNAGASLTPQYNHSHNRGWVTTLMLERNNSISIAMQSHRIAAAADPERKMRNAETTRNVTREHSRKTTWLWQCARTARTAATRQHGVQEGGRVR